jgi:hypothetical protein
MLIETKYCFSNEVKNSTLNGLDCNPNAMPKIEDGKCICTSPYTGASCEDCESGYIKSKDRKGHHAICSLDLSRCSNDICNNHGQCIKPPSSNEPSMMVCKCDEKFDG